MAPRLDRSFYGQLLSSMEAGALEQGIPDDVWALLIAAYGYARAGRLVEARERIDRATAGDAPGLAFLVAGRLRYICRDHHESLLAFDEAARREPRLSGRALGAKARHAARIGWAPEARQTIETLRAQEPGQLRWHVEGLRAASRAEDHEPALRCADAALALEPRAASLHMARAGILARMGRAEEAVRAADDAVTLDDGGSIRYRLEAARVGMEVGDYAMSRRHLTRVREQSPRDVRPAAELARLALFASDTAGARSAIEPFSRSAPSHPSVLRTLAAIDVLEGRHESAVGALERATRESPEDSEAHTWLAEARMRLGRWDGVYAELHRATMNADGLLLPELILRSLSHMNARDDGDDRYHPVRYEELSEVIDALVAGGRTELESRDRTRIIAVLEAGLEALGGNRTSYSSHVVDGELRAFPIRTSPRHSSRRALQLIRSAEPRRALEALGEVVERFPSSSLPLAHRGELHLWLGDLEAARADLERAIAITRGTRWAWIGLTGIETLEGRPERALEVSARGVDVMNGTVGASVYAYRADAYAALGRLDDALSDLETSVRLSPSRLGARIALARLLDLVGQGARADVVFRQLLEDAPGLFSDAARDEGIVLWKTREPRPSSEERRRLAERALQLLGGNRSSTCVTYRTSEGVLRFVPRPGGRRPHRGEDEDDLARVRSLLMQAVGLSRGKRRERRVQARATVDPAMVDQFVSRGYVRLRGAFSREVAERWVSRAAKRIREAPARWVCGYDANDQERALDAFDPANPATWTWSRVDVRASETMELADVAPGVWDLACALVGGVDRFEQTAIGDHLIVNFNDRSHSDRAAPELGESSWHLDDPQPSERLSTFRRGLILFIVLSDLPTASGAPFIAPESVTLVARELAAHPAEGVDFVDRETSMRLSSQCTERVELVGAVGDVYVVHPMMLHSSSGNPSGRIRWMGNPILSLREPIRPDADDPSPLERTVIDALRGNAR